MLFATRKIGRVRLVRIGRFCLAFGIIGQRPLSGRRPAWLSVDGSPVHIPEILA